MMIEARAEELGRLVGQSEEYKALRRANDRLMADQELRDAVEKLHQLQLTIASHAERGEDVSADVERELDTLTSSVQSSPLYQGIVAAQANFDKLMYRVNQQILEGIRKGAESRIITLG